MRVNPTYLSSFVAPGLILLPRQTVGAVGRRAGALFFARHLDNFIVTQNSQPSPGLGTIKTNYRDKKLSSTYRVPIAIGRQKTRHRDADSLPRTIIRKL